MWRSAAVALSCIISSSIQHAGTPQFQTTEATTLNWVRVTERAEWQPRDSCGELAFADRLWLMGGWFDSFQAPPRDVWSSADGKTWQRVVAHAPWKHSDLPMALAFNGRMWILGGWYNGRLPGREASSSVWSSMDGLDWQQVTKDAGWSRRLAAAAVVFQGKMWILGGIEDYYFGDDNSLKNDVWCSADGQHWKLATPRAEWSPRAYHQAVVLDGRIYLMGGGNYQPNYRAMNDVWSSADGVNWVQVTAEAPWNPRIWFSAVEYRNRLWVLGGWSNNPSRNWGDVWYSKNGRDWSELKSKTIWKERHEHSAYVFQDKIWIAGGHAQPLSNEVWSLEVPRDWLD
jgi:hypothetical protein